VVLINLAVTNLKKEKRLSSMVSLTAHIGNCPEDIETPYKDVCKVINSSWFLNLSYVEDKF
jgi:hypothetical protein